MHNYKPSRENKAHIIIPLILLLCTFVAITASQTAVAYLPSLLQFIGICCIVVAIQIITRYALCEYYYEINDDTRTLNITKIQGKKSTLVGSLDFNTIIAIDKKQKGFDLKEKYNKKFKVINFCTNMFPSNAYYLVTNVNGADIAIIIETNEEFLSYLKRGN